MHSIRHEALRDTGFIIFYGLLQSMIEQVEQFLCTYIEVQERALQCRLITSQ
jgi:hypothetical protein